MTKIKGYVVIAFLIVCVLYLVSIFEIKDQYDKELSDLRLENKKINYELKQKKKDNQTMSLAIESLLDQVNGKRSIDCDCAWYEDFYYEYMKEVGANE